MVYRNFEILALAVVALFPFTIGKAVDSDGKIVSGFTFLGSRKSYSNLTKTFEQSNYYASAASGIWMQATDDCLKTFGPKGHLVSIETEEEQTAINNWLLGGLSYWTSGAYDLSESKWIWRGNTEYQFSNYENWLNNTRPVNPNGRKRIALASWAYGFQYKWIAEDDIVLERYICEVNSAENVGTEAPTADLN